MNRLLFALRAVPDAVLVAAWFVGLSALLASGMALSTGLASWAGLAVVLWALVYGVLRRSRAAWLLSSILALVALFGVVQERFVPTGVVGGGYLVVLGGLAAGVLVPLWLPPTVRHFWARPRGPAAG